MRFRTVAKAASQALICLVALGATSTAAHAQVLFDNGPGDPGASGAQGDFADTGNPEYAAGDVFTPAAGGVAQSISFAGFYYNGGTPTAQPADNFTIYLYSVASGTPDSPDTLISQSSLSDESSSQFATSTSTMALPGAFSIYEFSGNLATPFTLNSTTEYYLGISDSPTPDVEFTLDVTPGYVGPATNGWGLENNNYPSLSNLSANTTPTQIESVPFSFALNAAALPEPSAGALLLAGIGGLIALRQLRRNSEV